MDLSVSLVGGAKGPRPSCTASRTCSKLDVNTCSRYMLYTRCQHPKQYQTTQHNVPQYRCSLALAGMQNRQLPCDHVGPVCPQWAACSAQALLEHKVHAMPTRLPAYTTSTICWRCAGACWLAPLYRPVRARTWPQRVPGSRDVAVNPREVGGGCLGVITEDPPGGRSSHSAPMATTACTRAPWLQGCQPSRDRYAC